jgi:hypothetical protein
MDKPSIYIETTIISYLAARPSPSLAAAAYQQITMDWWEKRRSGFDLFASEIVMLEARSGDPDAVARRLTLLEGIPELILTSWPGCFCLRRPSHARRRRTHCI